MQHKQFAVIGLGRFGRAVCRTLHTQGHEVLGIDASEDEVRSAHAEAIATHVMQADTTDRRAIEEADIGGVDAVVLAIGTDLEASVLTVLNLIEVGVKRIIAKAATENYGKVLQRVGGETLQVVYPEAMMGERVANVLSGAAILETIDLDPDYSIVEVPAPAKLVGKTLGEADIRGCYGVTVIAIKGRQGVNIAPWRDDRIQPGDVLAVVGHRDSLQALMHPE